MISTKQRHKIKEEPTQRMEKFGTRPKTKITGQDHADIAEHRIVHHYTNAQHKKQTVTNAEEKDTTKKYADESTSTTEQ